ncbi:MAG: extracellular solute-binding protein [Chloroflexi bacterium]|nr:extracellular solute-binding protein [Chloroflexota bacterium]MCC6892964.1 extracellular solute-binding protein [Anaerolineae bacterium]
MRKLLSVLSLILVFAMGLGVIRAQDSIEEVDPSGQTVVYWHQYQNESAQGNTIAAIVEQFNATNEYGITVEASFQGTYSDLSALVNAGITSGELPNLVAGYANDAASYARDASAVDLTPYLTSEKWGLGATPDINQALIAANTVDGQVLAWPNQSSAQVFAYNQTLLTELGFDAPPTTIEEFKEQACAASEATNAAGGDVQGFAITTDASAFESWVASQGGSIYHDGAFDFTSEAVINTFQLYQDLYSQGCAYIPAERFGEQVDFNNALLPFYITSTAGFTFVIDGFKTSGIEADWKVQPFPHTEGNEIVQAFVPSIILMPSTPEAQLASWLFLKYMASPDVATQWSAGTGYFNPVPSTAAALETATFTAEGLAPYFNESNALLTKEGVTVYSSPAISAYSTVRGLISTAIADVTSNAKPVAEVAEGLQAAAEQAVADSQ